MRHKSVIWRNNKKLKHKQEQELKLARCWMDASDNERSEELEHEPKDELDLARCWRDASNSSVNATAGTKKGTNEAVALKRKMVLQPGMNTERLEMPKKPPWGKCGDNTGDVPISGPVSLMLSLHGYFLDNCGDQPMGYPMSKPTGKLVQGCFKKKNRAQNYERLCPLGDVTNPGTYIERRSVLEYIQFGHTTGQHWCVQSILNCEVLMTSRGYYGWV